MTVYDIQSSYVLNLTGLQQPISAMRSFFILFLFVNLSAGLPEWKLRNRLKKSLSSLKSKLNVDRLLQLRRRLDKHVKAPKLDVLQRALLVERLEEMSPMNGTNIHQTIEYINERQGISDLFFQGDIVLTTQLVDELTDEDGSRSKRQASLRASKWLHNRFYFSFRSGQRNNIMKAMARRAAKIWHDNTCVDMIEDATQAERVEIFEGKGCYSYVGNIHKVQELSLGSDCHQLGTMAHELAHALGLYHVQSRYDRDKYVVLNLGNIPPSLLKSDFNKETVTTSTHYDIPYDYGSVMHYSATAFAIINSQPTILPVDKDYMDTMGSPFVSFYDILLMNKHYGCFDRCKAAFSAKCKMGGLPNPRDCSKCICPGGYGGRLCDQRPSGCGDILKATTKAETLELSLGSKGNNALSEHEKCHFWIVPQGSGRKIQVILKDVYSQWVGDGCTAGGVEIKSQADQRLTGYRYCRYSSVGKVFVSANAVFPVIAYRDRGMVQIAIEYQMI